MALTSLAIMKCSCEHEYQDQKYGLEMRVHNPMMNGQYRCTVCQAVRGSIKPIDVKKGK
jgi:hypothetical protein